jgi:hypothetical protein
VPWREPEVPGEFPTLGYQVADWIESRCAIPDREEVGKPFLLTDEQLRFLLHFYRLDPETGSFHYVRGAQLVRPHKWGKGPLTAAIICAEAQGPVLFDGWDASGEPVGKAWSTPVIQVTAVSEDQTENIYTALKPMIELGALHAEIEDTGLGRINLPGGGLIKPVTSSARSRLGQRITFAAQDQTESWTTTNGGRELADNQRRQLAAMNGRWLSTPNAYDPTENSVAQYTAEQEVKIGGVYEDDIEPPEGLSIRNKVERRRALKIVYGDSITGTRGGKKGEVKGWINPDRIDAEILALLPRDPQQAERWFLNRKEADEAKAFNVEVFRRNSRRRKKDSPLEPDDGALIVIGGDGARFADGLGLIATEVETGYQWSLGIWEVPASAPDDYEHPFDEVDGAMVDAFERFEVYRAYLDPQYIEDWVDLWQGRWGEKRVIRWHTNRNKPIAWAVRRYTEAVATGAFENSGDEDFVRHMKNAVKRPVSIYDERHRKMHSIGKDGPDSPRKMDGAMAAVLSWEARGDAIREGAKPKSRKAYFI